MGKWKGNERKEGGRFFLRLTKPKIKEHIRTQPKPESQEVAYFVPDKMR